MIALSRLRTAKAIKAKYRGADKRDKDIELMKAQRDKLNGLIAKIEFDSSFWKLSKAQLKKESFGKCAYCEANTEVVAHGDVEHYRPKSNYWWLAYTYDNYLYACQICNQSYKSDNFPFNGIQFPEPQIRANSTDNEINLLAGNISPDPIDININYTLQKYLQQHQQESAYLLNPYFDNPANYIAYEANDVLEEVKIMPLVPNYLPYIKAMEDFYGINRVELKSFRYNLYRLFRAIKVALPNVTDVAIKKDIVKQIEFMKSDKALFAGMIRYFDDIL
jgi:uncharacterized protein (TIGR02646 family)